MPGEVHASPSRANAVMADAPFKDPNGLIREHLERVVAVKGDLYVGPGGLKVIAVKEVKAAR
jgi:hypothetical protein